MNYTKMKFRKKPVAIEAMQFDASDVNIAYKLSKFFFGEGDRINIVQYNSPGKPAELRIRIETLEGDMVASPGDWIIKGVKGELYPCKPDIFKSTYELYDDSKLLNFGQAIEAIKEGKRVARKGWNGKGMFLKLIQGYPVNGHLNHAMGKHHDDGRTDDDISAMNSIPKYTPDGELNTITVKPGQMLSHIVMKTAGDSQYYGSGYSDYVPWLASQTDMLSEDWVIL